LRCSKIEKSIDERQSAIVDTGKKEKNLKKI